MSMPNNIPILPITTNDHFIIKDLTIVENIPVVENVLIIESVPTINGMSIGENVQIIKELSNCKSQKNHTKEKGSFFIGPLMMKLFLK
jgi:hypothetical protein